MNHNPPCVRLLHLMLDFVNDHLSKTCQLSGLTLLVGFQMMFWFCAYNGDYAGHIPLPLGTEYMTCPCLRIQC